jgi:hypothetical protein
MKLNELYPSKYVKGEDLQNRSHTLTIDHIAQEEMTPQQGKPKVEKWILYCQETDKGFILNRTNATVICGLYGDTDNWKGKRITVYPQPVVVAGTQRIAIRIKKPE